MPEAPDRDLASLKKVGMRVGGLLDLGASLVTFTGVDWTMRTDKAEIACSPSPGTLLRQQLIVCRKAI